jgi:hypothetical protein
MSPDQFLYKITLFPTETYKNGSLFWKSFFSTKNRADKENINRCIPQRLRGLPSRDISRGSGQSSRSGARRSSPWPIFLARMTARDYMLGLCHFFIKRSMYSGSLNGELGRGLSGSLTLLLRKDMVSEIRENSSLSLFLQLR